jgi:hypothetical protein
MNQLLTRSAAPWVLLSALLALATGCKKEIDDTYTLVGERFPTVVSNTTPFPLPATKYAVGETVTLELNFAQQTDPIKEIVVLQKVEPARDSVVVQTIPYKPAFSKTKNADTLLITYVVPTAVNKALVRVDARVVSTNGQFKTRSASFRVAEATPTIRVNSATNVTAPGTSTPVPGDVVRYNLTLNDGGITSATALTTAGILFNNLDSLITYVKVGTAAERRFARQRLPAAGTQTGAATTLNLDVTLPAGSSGQPVVFRFEAKTRFLGTPAVRTASATATALTPGTPTPLAAARTATLSYAGTTGGDLAALDLTTFAPVAANASPGTKDVAITSTATNAVRLQSLNATATPPVIATRFVRLATGGAAAYSAATLNSIRQAYLNTAATSQLTQLDNVVVGDVVIARLRGLDQYTIFTVTGINRTSATDVALTLAIKAL